MDDEVGRTPYLGRYPLLDDLLLGACLLLIINQCYLGIPCTLQLAKYVLATWLYHFTALSAD